MMGATGLEYASIRGYLCLEMRCLGQVSWQSWRDACPDEFTLQATLQACIRTHQQAQVPRSHTFQARLSDMPITKKSRRASVSIGCEALRASYCSGHDCSHESGKDEYLRERSDAAVVKNIIR